MAYYRLTFMNGLSGHVTGFVELEAETDDLALDQAAAAMPRWSCGANGAR